MEELRRVYKKRRAQLLPLIFGFCAFFIFFRVVLPQWEEIKILQEQTDKLTQEADKKEDEVLLLNSLSLESINENFQIATTALPIKKDIVLIFSQLEQVAQQTGVDLGGFSVKVGGIYETDPKQITTKGSDSIPVLSIQISVDGSSDNLRVFAEKLYESVPLVEIVSVDISKRDARFDVNFYYLPIKPIARANEGKSITKFSQKELNDLELLRSWRPEGLTASGF